MQDAGYAALQIVPSFKDLRGNLERGSSKALTAAGMSGGTRFGDSAGRSAGSRFGSVFKKSAKVALVGIGAIAATAIGGAVKVGLDALDEAREAQKVGRQTAAVIKSTGGAAKVSTDDVGKLAGKLSYMAGVDDELVQSGANVLLTFKNVRNETGKRNKIFDRATKVALNMSTALGTDLKGASLQVGKAMNDPVKGITALTRAGVTFSTKQKAQIKALVEGGDANAAMALGLIDTTTTYTNLLKENGGDAQKVADILKRDLNPAQKEAFDHYAEGNHLIEAQRRELKELGSEFGGSARSQTSASDRLKVAIGNVEEKLGKGLLPLVQDFSRFLLRKGVPAAEKFSDWFTKKGVPGIEDFIDEAKPAVQKWLPKIGAGLQNAAGFGKDVAGFLGDALDAFDKMPGWAKKILIGGALGGAAAKKFNVGSLLFGSGGKGLTGGSGGLLGLVSKAKPIPVFVTNPGGLGGVGGGVKPPVVAPGTPGSLPKFAPLIPVGLGSAPDQNSPLFDAFGFNPFGLGKGSDNKLPIPEVKEFNRKLTETERIWTDSKAKANDYFMFVKNNAQTEIHFTVLGWDVANRQAREYLANLLAIRNAHNEARLDRAGVTSPVTGGGIAPNLDPTPHGGKRGVNITVEKVVAQDVNGMLRDLQGRAHRAGLDGVGE